ncbi:putative non-specific serine/threonine protein kinase [Helianthus annuus]|nr:putative non-specific serine/threonine protein kinase [Helianthus annuus]
MLLEIIARKRVLHDPAFRGGENLVGWAKRHVAGGNQEMIPDSAIRGQISSKALKKLVKLVEHCVKIVPEPRPVMTAVLAMLEEIRALESKLVEEKDSSVLG